MTSCKFSATLAALLGALAANAASAQTYTLNFDTDFSGNKIAGGGSPYGTLVSDAYTIPGVRFNSNDYIYSGGAGGTTSGVNFASGLGDLAPFEIVFTKPQDRVSAFNITNSEYTLTAYDAANNTLGAITTSTDFEKTTLAFPGDISKIIFTATNTAGFGFGYGFDDLSFSSAAVPEPGSLALLAGVMATGGALLLRRKRK